MPQPTRIGIIGAGGIVKHRHLPGFRKIDGVEIVAVCNRSEESTNRFADENNIPHRFSDWRDLVHSPEVDAVVVGTWPYMHRDCSIETLKAGKPVFCQARMARNVEEAREMLAAQKESGQVAMLCPPPIGLKWDRVIKRLLAEKTIGKVLTIRVSMMGGDYLDHDAPIHWRQIREYSGNNVLTLGIMAEVIHRWFGKHKSAMAYAQTHVTARMDPATGEEREVDIPDAVWVNGEMESGALIQYSFSGLAHLAPKNCVEIYGCHGTIVYDFVEEKILTAQLGESSLKEMALSDDQSKVWEVELDFIRAVRGEAQPEPSFEDGVDYMEWVDAVTKSYRMGAKVTLPLGG